MLSPVDPAHYIQPREITQDLEDAGYATNPLAPSQMAIDEAAKRDTDLAAKGLGSFPSWGDIGASEFAPLSPDEQFDALWVSGEIPELTNLPPGEQTLIREEADKRGIDPQLYLEETHRQVQEIIREVDTNSAIEQGLRDILEQPGAGDSSFDQDPLREHNPPEMDLGDAGVHRAGVPSIVELGGDIPMAGSGRTAEAPGFLAPKTNTADIIPEVLTKYGKRRLPASIRLNNMGGISITGAQANIPNTWAARQPGFVGVVKRPANEGGWYAQYATPEDGVRAASTLLIRYGEDGVDTPSEIARKWAVGSRAAYAATTTRFLNEAGFEVTADTPLDLNDPEVRLAILRAKSAHESGFGRPIYNDDVYERALGLGTVMMASNE